MMLSLVLSLTMALCMISLFLGGRGFCILPDWARVSMDVLPEHLKQVPIVAESMASKWPSSIGLCSPHGWVMVRRDVVPEGLKRPPIRAQTMASDLPYPLGWLWHYLVRVDMTLLLCRA